MIKQISFPSINQFRNVVRSVKDRANYHGMPIPTLKFEGTVKLHGTNAGVARDAEGNIWAQSRERIITPGDDNAGFAAFVEKNKDIFKTLFDIIYEQTTVLSTDIVVIYGEWCGQGINKNVAVVQLPKMFVLFGIRIAPDVHGDEDGNDDHSIWLNSDMLLTVLNEYDRVCQESNGELPENLNIFSITEFEKYYMEIDFNAPENSQNQLAALTQAVEDECPVGRAFQVSGTGEGIVWRYHSGAPEGFNKTTDLIFKVKGEKHSDSKVTKLAEVDVEKVASIKNFAAMVVTDHRLEKMVEKLKELKVEIDIKNTGAFLKLVGADVLKEESDTIDASGFTRQEVMPAVNAAAKQWWMKLINTF